MCEGFANSFIEFFYLTHRYDENGDLQEDCDFSEDELVFLKENLVMAELSEMKSDLKKSHLAYKNIGDFFKQSDELETAVYFYKKSEFQVAPGKTDPLVSQSKNTINTSNVEDSKSSTNAATDHTVAAHATDENQNNQNVFVDNESKNDLKVLNSEQNSSKNIYESTSADLIDQQLITYLDLGLTYELLKQINNAIHYYTKYLDLANLKLAKLKTDNTVPSSLIENKQESRSTATLSSHSLSTNGTGINAVTQMISVGNRNLIRTYKLQSDKYKKEGKLEESMSVLQQCIEVAAQSSDLSGEAVAHLSMADILMNSNTDLSNSNDTTISHEEHKNNLNRAAEHLKKLLKISLEIEDLTNEARAYFRLGNIYKQLNDSVLASKYYESYMNAAVSSGNLRQESEACVKLADVFYYNIQDIDQAAIYYTKHFEICRKLRKTAANALSRNDVSLSKDDGSQGSNENDSEIISERRQTANHNADDGVGHTDGPITDRDNDNRFVGNTDFKNLSEDADTIYDANESLNIARIKVGIAKAEQMMSDFLSLIVKNDSESIRTLLRWKAKRVKM